MIPTDEAPSPAKIGCIAAAREVSLEFSGVRVLKNLSLTVKPGERILLLGANGAGKSSLLSILAGLLNPSSGSATSRYPVGYVGHQPGLYSGLTVRENLTLFSSLQFPSLQRPKDTPTKRVDISTQQSNMLTLAKFWRLESILDQQVATLSRGTLQRVALCRVAMLRTNLFLLDEPTAALDDSSVILLLSFLENLNLINSDAAVIMATHDLVRLRGAATSIVVLHEGEAYLWSGTENIDAGIAFYQSCNR